MADRRGKKIYTFSTDFLRSIEAGVEKEKRHALFPSIYLYCPHLGRLPVSGREGLIALGIAARLALLRARAVLDPSATPVARVAVQPLLKGGGRLCRHFFVGVGGRPVRRAALGEAPLRRCSEIAASEGHGVLGRGVAAGLFGRARDRGGGGRDREGEEDGGPHRCQS